MHFQYNQLMAVFVAGVAAMVSDNEDKRDLKACNKAAMDILPALTGIPTAKPSLMAYLVSEKEHQTATDPCAIPKVTGSLSADYTSWISAISSWQNEHSDDLSSILHACSDVPEITSSLGMMAGQATMCENISWPTEASSSDSSSSATTTMSGPHETSKGSSKGSSTGTSTGSSSATTTTSSGDAGPRETGAAAAAFAIAAVVAAAI